MMKKTINFLFNNNTEKRVQSLLKSVSKQHKELRQLKEDYSVLNKWYLDYYEMLNNLSRDMNASIWRKNTNHEYIIANPNHCKNFFGIPDTPECLTYIRGKTDKQLIDELYRDNGFYNTYGEICTMSDEYTLKQNKTVHLLEGGIIDNNQVLLYLMKIPQHDENGNITGTHGIAWDFTDYSKDIITMLSKWKYDNKINTLYCKGDVFCYVLNPEIQECDVFKHLCPFDKKNEQHVCEYAC